MSEHETHEEIDAMLRQHFARVDPVPPEVTAAAKVAFELRDLDAQIAELLADTAAQDKELAGVRGDGPRLLTFAWGDRFAEVEVVDAAEERTLVGYVVPAEAGTLRVQSPAGEAVHEIDGDGRFRVPALLRGPMRLRIELPSIVPLVTPWTPI